MITVMTMEQFTFYMMIGLSVITLISIILMIVSLCKLKKLRRRMDALTRGKDTESMEDIMLNFFERIETLENHESQTNHHIKEMKETLRSTYQKSALVKYDAFREMSGALSYSLALLDQENNGVLISSMYSREGCYTYAKDVENGKCKINLSEEEEEALKQAVAK